ncbi:sialidase family protein [Spirosoma sp. KNUC1025]|uniref:sialidase family protein n=1 Tax=Spirosoma sp. KNUC1025 TaxID=2894082 RepID=UPI0038654375|nr:glycoside hydrolase [Spirosoma sp. KNUC1025]
MNRTLRNCILYLVCLSGLTFAQTPDSSQVPGTVVAHSPASSGLYIGSPSLCILPNGDYLASHDLFGPKSEEFDRPVSRIYRSRDQGKTWTPIADIIGQFWSKLFVHRGKLYFLGTDKHHGNVIIRTSLDDGITWSNPTNSQDGLLLTGEYHCGPMPLVEYKGRLWRAMEDAMGPVRQWGKRYGAFLLSIPIYADLMDARNWSRTNVLRYDSTYLNGHFGGWLEGNAVVSPNGQLLDILRVDDKSTLYEKAALVSIGSDGKTATFDPATGFISLPGGSKKFGIRYDPKSHLYWTMANIIPEDVQMLNRDKNPASIRNTQALCSSKDLRHWDVRRVILTHPDVAKHAFQYVDWQFDGRDMIFLSRTAYEDEKGGAHNSHDANFLTFHRIKNFRKL